MAPTILAVVHSALSVLADRTGIVGVLLESRELPFLAYLGWQYYLETLGWELPPEDPPPDGGNSNIAGALRRLIDFYTKMCYNLNSHKREIPMKELFFFIRRIVRANTARRFAAGLRRRAEADYVAIVAKEPRLATPLQSLRRKHHGG